ncbi:dual specificity protein kinase yak1 [Savitreella phatthalungensis]
MHPTGRPPTAGQPPGAQNGTPWQRTHSYSHSVGSGQFRDSSMRSAGASDNFAVPSSAISPSSPYRSSPRKSPSMGLGGAMSPRLQPLTPRDPHPQPTNKLRRVAEVGLRPRRNMQPPLRRAKPEGGYLSPLQAATTHLTQTYRICNPNFDYQTSSNPRRVLTKPSEGVNNGGFDNEDSDYILYVNDVLGIDEGHKYLILDVLGQGTFGQVVKCQNMKTLEVVAVKVIKNKTAYFNQSMMEVTILDLLNNKLDQKDEHHILRLKDTFIHRHHLCLVFELLSVNLYELIKQNHFRGLSMNLVRVFATQLLDAMIMLNEAKIIHCDLKPENILLKNLETPNIKVIDFGSACHERQTVYTYIQSRFYRSPEVLLGLPYSAAIDIWSLGCIVAELFLGLPLFPGSSEYNQITRIAEMMGLPPAWMLEMGKQSGEFFEKSIEEDAAGRKRYRLKSLEQYSREHGVTEQPSKRYFNETTLHDLVLRYPLPKKNMSEKDANKEIYQRTAFIDFIRGLLNLNPLERWSPQQAKQHPFITGQRYQGPFVPPMFRSAKKPSAENPLPPPPSHRNQAPQQKAAEQLIASQAAAHEKAEAVRQQQEQEQRQQQQVQQQMSPTFSGQTPILASTPENQIYGQQPQQSFMFGQPPSGQMSPADIGLGLSGFPSGPSNMPYMYQGGAAIAGAGAQSYGMSQGASIASALQQPPPAAQQQHTFQQRRARAGTLGNIDSPVHFGRHAAALNPTLRNSPIYGYFPDVRRGGDPAQQAYLGTGQGSGDVRRGSIHPPPQAQQGADGSSGSSTGTHTRQNSEQYGSQYFPRWQG